MQLLARDELAVHDLAKAVGEIQRLADRRQCEPVQRHRAEEDDLANPVGQFVERHVGQVRRLLDDELVFHDFLGGSALGLDDQARRLAGLDREGRRQQEAQIAGAVVLFVQ